MSPDIVTINGYLGNQIRFEDCRKWISIDGTLSVMTRPNTKQILAANLRRLMDASETLDTQVKVASKAGIAQSSVGRLLRAEVAAQLDQVEALAEAFKVSVADLLSDKTGTPAQEIRYDRDAYARLDESAKEQIALFIEFVTTRKGHADSTALSIGGTSEVPPELKARLIEAIQRELNENTLTLGHERDQQKTSSGRQKRS